MIIEARTDKQKNQSIENRHFSASLENVKKNNITRLAKYFYLARPNILQYQSLFKNKMNNELPADSKISLLECC